jgi:hypothetical protein
VCITLLSLTVFASKLSSGLDILLMNYSFLQPKRNMLKETMVEQLVSMKKLIVFGGIIIALTLSGTKKESTISI